MFELAQRGASRSQLAAAEAALRSVAASKAQAEALVKSEAAYNSARASATRYGAYLATLSVAAGAAVAAIIKRSINAQDAFNDLKDATGASIENISALDRIARETGGGFESMSSTLVKFNQVLSKTDDDSAEAARILKALGLNAEELRKIDPAEALRQTAVALAKVADDGSRARAIQVLFGKSVREAAPLLNDLAEKTELVATTTTAAALKAEDFNKKIFQIKANAEDAARILASSLIPTVADAAEGFFKNSGEGGWGSILSAVGSFFGGGRAIGGPVSAGKMYRVNERRPEVLDVGGQQFLMMGNQSGKVQSAGTKEQSVVVTNNFTLQQPASRETQQQIASRAGAAITAAMRRGTA